MSTQAFQMPKAVKITGRSSTITNSFVSAIIPVIEPSSGEIVEALRLLQMTPNNVRCAYCGDHSTEWDHLNPLVHKQRPTGFVSEISNLVPACGKCNQSKGNKPWKAWMFSAAPRSPKSRGVENLERRAKLIEGYEESMRPTRYEFSAIVNAHTWESYWSDWESVITVLRESQRLADVVRSEIAGHVTRT